ncbi:FAD-binding protein [Roseovarius salis]|uniref:FAD-binding oxidoreductase n=1 Tax=Roseovarius salis TaxID=3376063 RepID=UPI0037CB846A
MRLSGWGRYPVADCAVTAPRDEAGLRRAQENGPLIARGNGRAYGDSAMNRTNTIAMHKFDRMIAFDAATGLLTAEAGVLVGDIIDAFLPRGWFPPVTPGTKFVTLGGAIAADVHGKNHHLDGGFGNFVEWIELMVQDGSVIRATPEENADLFRSTVGGMGLTGVILRAAVRLRGVETGWIRQTAQAVPDLDGAMAAFEAAADAPYSVAWIDCLSRGASLGRSIVMLGEHATLEGLPTRYRQMPFGPPPKRKFTLPVNAPGFTLNRWTVRAFNAAYYHANARRAGASYVPWDSYFYPLDSILGWNRVYGRRGFVQFQCVLPEPEARDGLAALLNAISGAGQGCFLSVLKKLGASCGRFSFPMPGYTLALDFPVSDKVLDLMQKLDRITLDHGGRFYLAKDARLSADTLHAADPRAAAFAQARKDSRAAGAFASLQSERLKL